MIVGVKKMTDINVIDSDYELFKTNNNIKIAIIASKFNSLIVDTLISGCIDTLQVYGINKDNILLVKVPGAVELPYIAKQVASNKNIAVSGIVALGAVIRGDTPHFDFVAGECMAGLSRVSLEYNLPITNGVLTTNSMEQALERAGGKAGNKGSEAALAVLNVLSVAAKLNNNSL
jgi:6,7-dimethyl-8-ribityllumazine synthase